MGSYTGLRCKVKLKEEFVPVVEKLIQTREWSNLSYAFLDEFSTYSRADSIPFAQDRNSMPYLWVSDEELNDWKNRTEEDIWIFQCSLKNYDKTLECFLKNVLSVIAEEAYHIEIYDEDWDSSKFYELINDKIIVSEREGILYTSDWSDWL